MTPSCSIAAEEFKDRLKIDLFSTQLWNEKIAHRVIIKHPKIAANSFHIAKEEEKDECIFIQQCFRQAVAALHIGMLLVVSLGILAHTASPRR